MFAITSTKRAAYTSPAGIERYGSLSGYGDFFLSPTGGGTRGRGTVTVCNSGMASAKRSCMRSSTVTG